MIVPGSLIAPSMRPIKLVSDSIYLGDQYNAGGAPFTFPNFPIGDPDPSRLIVVTHTQYAATATQDMYIDGQAMTRVIRTDNGNMHTAIFCKRWPNGTLATFTSNAPNNTDRLIAYALYGIESETPIATAGSIGNPANLNMNVQANSYGVGISFDLVEDDIHTWNGMTERNEWYWGAAGGNKSVSAASEHFLIGESPRTINVSTNSNRYWSNCAAAWK